MTEIQVSTLAAIYRALSEHEHQRELFSWAVAVRLKGLAVAGQWIAIHPRTLNRPSLAQGGGDQGDSRLNWMFAIPNGGSRGGNTAQRQREGARMRSEGVKRGVADIFLPVAHKASYGLWIELKKFGGRQSKEQQQFEAVVTGEGYSYVLAVGYLEAISAIEKHLLGGEE